MGAQMLRQAAQKTGDVVGDGTSTATVLAQAIYADGVRNVTAGASSQIALNSAADGGVVVDRMITGKGYMGFDAARQIYVDLYEAGIIDPVKVVRTALENAVSVAGILLLTEATLTERREKPGARPDAESGM